MSLEEISRERCELLESASCLRSAIHYPGQSCWLATVRAQAPSPPSMALLRTPLRSASQVVCVRFQLAKSSRRNCLALFRVTASHEPDVGTNPYLCHQLSGTACGLRDEMVVLLTCMNMKAVALIAPTYRNLSLPGGIASLVSLYYS